MKIKWNKSVQIQSGSRLPDTEIMKLLENISMISELNSIMVIDVKLMREIKLESNHF